MVLVREQRFPSGSRSKRVKNTSTIRTKTPQGTICTTINVYSGKIVYVVATDYDLSADELSFYKKLGYSLPKPWVLLEHFKNLFPEETSGVRQRSERLKIDEIFNHCGY